MRDTARLPDELRMSVPGRAMVYPTPGPARGDLLEGMGHWVLLFEPAKEKNMARIRLRDLAFRFQPTSCLHFDVNGDGLLERLDLGNFCLTLESIDLEQSGGTMNLETGDVTFKLVISIDPREIPGLERMLEPIRIDLTERGRFDLARGQYHAASDLSTIPNGPLAGLTIINCMDKLIPYTARCAAAVALGVYVLGGKTPTGEIPAGQAPKDVWVCPGTEIRLLWDSTNADAVVIDPDLGQRPPKGQQVIPDPASLNARLHQAITQSKSYVAETTGKCITDEDHVTINVIEGGEEIPQKAAYVDRGNYWSATLPDHTYDHRIRVSRIVIDIGRADSITWPSWRVDHVYTGEAPVGTPIGALNNWEATAQIHSLPGEYRFTPMPSGAVLPSGEKARKLYFRLLVEKC